MIACEPAGSVETVNVARPAEIGDVPSNAPISYTANGKQYVAMVVGNGGAQAITFPPLVPEIRNPPDRGAGVWVFELR